MKYDSEQIGKKIREERQRIGMTQDELGKELFISGKQISNYEKGTPLPSLDTLLKIAEVFHCELGFLLGEESYENRSKLDTAICASLGLTEKAVDALRKTIHNCLPQEADDRQRSISSFFESPYLGAFFDRLVDAADISRRLERSASSFEQSLVTRYGEEVANKVICSSLISRNNPDGGQTGADTSAEFDDFINEMRNDEYALKVARYELREAFEDLVRYIF